MAVWSEPLAEAERRIHEKSFGPITGARRLARLGAAPPPDRNQVPGSA
jgi:hypothetical protein